MQRVVQRTDLPVLDDIPLEALDVETDSKERREDDDRLDAILLAHIVLRLSGPVEEGHHILGHLGGSRGGS